MNARRHPGQIRSWRRRVVSGLAVALVALLGPGFCLPATTALPSRALPLQHVGDFPLPGGTTRWDYLSLDPARSRLFIAHLGDSAVVVMDTKTKATLVTIGDVGHVHGTLAVPELNRVYASATATNEVVAIDASTLKIVARIAGGVYPDGIAYAPEAGKLYVSDERGNTETVIDVRTNRRIATIELGGAVGNTQYDPASKHIFVNVQQRRSLVEIDPRTDKVIDRITLPGAEGNHGLLIAPALRLAFIACEGNDRLLVLDMKSKQIIANFGVGREPDVLGYDADLGQLYVASESGVLSIFKVAATGVTKVGEGFVGSNAHSLTIDPASHEIYLPLKDVDHHPVMRVMRP
ncbi:YncE family protein [Cupriavidus sp. WKF15]|uniref:YncE family protein n=1 Tax=Cupriavidus sp. WKF15 TaxID=3032282 RepID=UPI0023E3077C|nr:YncE family protein [Cupriavidus sp. WKF15]WER47306.1 YncE family protein [Cupriavidus sp. WKF15]